MPCHFAGDRVPDLPPGQYKVIVHDDKGPPGDRVYAVLETTAYVIFPPVWPFVFRSNHAEFDFQVTESAGAEDKLDSQSGGR